MAILKIVSSISVWCLLFQAGHAQATVNRHSMSQYLEDIGIERNSVETCSFVQENSCQSKGAGGHAASIFSTSDGFCAKKIRSRHNVKEIEFYIQSQAVCSSDLKMVPEICRFIPQFGGVCQKDGQLYVKMENLKKNQVSGLIMEDPWALDMKIGTKTASIRSMKRSGETALGMTFWTLVHWSQDRYLTSSHERGYRFAGFSAGRPDQFKAMGFFEKLLVMQNPERVIRVFSPTKQENNPMACFVRKIGELGMALNEESFSRFHLVGASALLIYDHHHPERASTDCSVYLIDFANSYILDQSPGDSDTVLTGLRKGVFHLANDFVHSTR